MLHRLHFLICEQNRDLEGFNMDLLYLTDNLISLMGSLLGKIDVCLVFSAHTYDELAL